MATTKPSSISQATTTNNPPTNPRGIPYAPFLPSVSSYVTTRADVQPTLNSFQEMISKYRFMELNTTRRLAGLRDKIPDISKTLETVRFLLGRSKGGGDDGDEGEKEEEEVDATFELNDTLFAKAKVPVMTNEVYLWLGANVMLAYPLEEAEELLKGKLLGAKGSAENCEEDLEFLREQITTLEVATARVYNWDVTEKRKEKAAGAGAGAEDEGQKS